MTCLSVCDYGFKYLGFDSHPVDQGEVFISWSKVSSSSKNVLENNISYLNKMCFVRTALRNILHCFILKKFE